MKKQFAILFLMSLAISSLHSIETLEFDEILHKHIQNISLSDYKKYIQENKKTSISKEWKTIVDKIFKKLILHSGNTKFTPEYSIIDKDTLNAFAFPGGQFIFHKGLFTKLDETIKKNEKAKDSKSLNLIRENYLAAIIGHELAHYYNNHSFKAFKKKFAAKNKGKEGELKLIRFDQEIELDADFTGLLYMQKAGYKPDYLKKVLQILNNTYQADLKSGEKINPYFETHPSPNERLSEVSGSDEKELYSLLAKLEKAYADIQMNQNLEKARKVIEIAQDRFPDSEEFLKANAVALHKQWLNTVPISEQKMKSIIELPSFRDEMTSSSTPKKAVAKKIPGDKALYLKAITAYRKIEEPSDAWLLSNYATILAYSPNSGDEKKSIELAKQAYKIEKSIQTINNIAVVYFLCNKQDQAQGILGEMVKIIHSDFSLKIKSSSDEGKKMASAWKNYLDGENKKIEDLEEDVGAILLNLILSDDNTYKNLSQHYYKEYDRKTVWAKYLENTRKEKIPAKKTNNPTLTVDGILPGDSIKDTLEKWNKPSRPAQIENGLEAWYYDEKGAKVSLHQGKIVEIFLYDEESPSLSNKIKVGTPKSKVDSILGDSTRKGKYHLYEKNGKIAVIYDEGVVERLYYYEND